MAGEKPVADQAAVETLTGLMWGWFVSRAIYAAAELGIADLLREGPRTVEELASASSAHPHHLHRLLRMLAAYGVFAEDSNGRFTLTPTGALLQTGALRDAARFMSEADWNAFGHLLHNVRTGEPAFKYVHGVGFFDYLSAHPEAQERFDRGMANAANTENPIVARAYDFGKFQRIADVGGGRGGLLAEILKLYPSSKGVLFDQAQVVAQPDYLRAAGVFDRCEIAGGNFFESVPKGADAYVLKRIIHDWDDDICVGLLRRCRDAVRDGGRVIVVDAVVPAGNEFHFSKPIDLLMMVLNDGRERTAAEFKRLFGSAGLKIKQIVPTASIVSVVEGEPV
jgi:O-methyltransferase domain/Dimerisation domain